MAGGRPPFPIDEEVLESLGKVGATNCEIAEHFGCSEHTIRERFAEKLAHIRANRKAKLRELQWRAAEQLNVPMLMFLGKKMLPDQAEGSENSVTPASIQLNYKLEKKLDDKDNIDSDAIPVQSA